MKEQMYLFEVGGRAVYMTEDEYFEYLREKKGGD